MAVRKGADENVLKKLLEAHRSVVKGTVGHNYECVLRIRDKKEWYPLHAACCDSSVEVIMFLINCRPELLVEEVRGKNALDWAIANDRDDKILDMLEGETEVMMDVLREEE